jgi:hypothetical protein
VTEPSDELVDVRTKITRADYAVLDGLSSLTGKDRSEIAREWLHERLQFEIDRAKLLVRASRGEGSQGHE